MPARTNLFQETVALLQTVLSGDASVSESVMLTDALTGTMREVDVVVESTLAGHPVVVALECRDHARPQDVTWVEQEIGKHARLPTNKLVLVSSSGFTREARQVAEKHHVALLTPRPLDVDYIAQLKRAVRSVWLRTIVTTPELLVVRLDAAPGWPAEELELPRDHPIYVAGRDEPVFSAGRFVQGFVDAILSLRGVNPLNVFTAEEDKTLICADFPLSSEGPDMYLLAADVDPPVLRRVAEVRVSAEVEIEVASVPMETAQLNGSVYAYGATTTSAMDVLMVTTNLDLDASGEAAGSVAVRVVTRAGRVVFRRGAGQTEWKIDEVAESRPG
ncbi:hypothetical protein BJF86_13275 [Serinicoccus sp. CNJ-927]|uniref:restriction endonuclease n=1 Tax=Serinicoccus sp. CNJ-927 TaxID=1904970 RepID=UPI000958EAE2|nr:restriction endonuclease [Serinicoccus sp. CNJ-927]OLT43926.1 hypothetical protein BJF86_13275 [Serinicoccus sp. CNJ-927]